MQKTAAADIGSIISGSGVKRMRRWWWWEGRRLVETGRLGKWWELWTSTLLYPHLHHPHLSAAAGWVRNTWVFLSFPNLTQFSLVQLMGFYFYSNDYSWILHTLTTLYNFGRRLSHRLCFTIRVKVLVYICVMLIV